MEREKSPKKLFVVRCPLGYTISLDLHCWNYHILRNHPDMAGHESDIKETIISPNEIRSNHKGKRLNFVYWKSFASKFKYLKVSAMIINKNKNQAIITTAHIDYSPHGGQKIWER